MTRRDSGTDVSTALRSVLGRLEELKKTAVGTVIYDQIEHVLEDYEDIQGRIDQAYGLIMHLLLDAYANNPTSEYVTEINARLIRAQVSEGPYGEEGGAAPVPPKEPQHATRPSPIPPSGEAEVDQAVEALLRRPAAEAATEPEPKPDVKPAVKAAEPRPGGESEISNVRQAAIAAPAAVPSGAERRVESAYRLHLDRKRGEIEKLQEALTKNVTEVMTQSREFGAMLQIELAALQQAEGAQEIENLRKILVGGIEELINGQRALDTKLRRTSDYLKLIKSDSDRLQDELHKVRLLSLTDEFTGLPNRRAFMRRLQDETGRAQRYGSPLAIALIDLDEFKLINDVHGHAAGDEVLRCYANHILSILRHHDLVARYGGEEFAVLLPNTTQEGAVAAIRKLKSRAREVQCTFEDKEIPMPTFSTGLTMYVPGDTHAVLINRADRALYRAKNLGRDRIEVEVALGPTKAAAPVPTDEGSGCEDNL